jgi:hypothetical protein
MTSGAACLSEKSQSSFSLYASEESLTVDALTSLYGTLSRMGHETRQGEVGVVIDGKYYGITNLYGGVSVMLNEAEIRQALRASRVVPLDVANPHGPLGLEQLAAAVASARGEQLPQRVQRPISLTVETWSKLTELAQTTATGGATPTSAAEVAAALLEQLVSGTAGK